MLVPACVSRRRVGADPIATPVSARRMRVPTVTCDTPITAQVFENSPDVVVPSLDTFCCRHEDCDGTAFVRSLMRIAGCSGTKSRSRRCFAAWCSEQRVQGWMVLAVILAVLVGTCCVIGVCCYKSGKHKAMAKLNYELGDLKKQAELASQSSALPAPAMKVRPGTRTC